MLTSIAVLLTVMVVGLWSEAIQLADRASAEAQFIAGSSQPQINMLKDAQERTNQRLDALIKLMTSGEAKVKVVELPAQSQAAGGAENATSKDTK